MAHPLLLRDAMLYIRALSGPSVRSHSEPPYPVALTGMERVTCRTLGSTLFEVGANTDDDEHDDDDDDGNDDDVDVYVFLLTLLISISSSSDRSHKNATQGCAICYTCHQEKSMPTTAPLSMPTESDEHMHHHPSNFTTLRARFASTCSRRLVVAVFILDSVFIF